MPNNGLVTAIGEIKIDSIGWRNFFISLISVVRINCSDISNATVAKRMHSICTNYVMLFSSNESDVTRFMIDILHYEDLCCTSGLMAFKGRRLG